MSGDRHAEAFSRWYEGIYGADYPNGTEFDSGEMYEAFAAGAAQAAAAERERIRHAALTLFGEQTSDHAPIETQYGLTCRTCVDWQDDEGQHEFGIAIPVPWPCGVAKLLDGEAS